jgi:hypothetical protein
LIVESQDELFQNPNIKAIPRIKAVPPEKVEALYNVYVSYFRVARTLHYSLGVLGLVFSLFATSGFGGDLISRSAALGGGICFSVLGFVDPNSRYKKCVRAARILNIAIMRYEDGEISQKELLAAVELTENLVTEYEETEITTLPSHIPKIP